MNITKQMADDIASELTKPLITQIEKLNNKFTEILYDLAKADIDPKLIAIYENPDFEKYINTTSYVRLRGCGFNYETRSCKSPLPISRNSFNQFELVWENNDPIGLSTFKLFDKIKDESKKLELLKFEIRTTLIELRTVKRVEKEFPEAFKFIKVPTKTTNQLLVNISPLRYKIKALK